MAATDFNWATTAVPGGDVSIINTDGTNAFTPGMCVTLDATNYLTVTSFSGFPAGLPSPGVKQSGAGDYIFGIAIENIPLGAQGRVRRIGIAQCLAAGAITAGNVVKAAASGQVTPTTAAAAQIGQALNTTTTANDPVLVALDIAKNA